VIAFAALVAGASAFVAPRASLGAISSARDTQGAMQMAAEDMVGSCAPLGFFDPLGLSKKSDAELQKFRECELKHGRVAMLAVLGCVVQEVFHPLFGGDSGDPWSLAAKVPFAAWAQTLAFIGGVELLSNEIKKQDGYVTGDLFGASVLVDAADEGWENYQLKELNQGRAAMFGIMGMLTHSALLHQGPIEFYKSNFML